jgi:hydroxyquinol 1,2-dioxygenase
MAGAPDARFLEIMSALVRNLHDFAREAKLTEAEWMAGVDALTRCGHWSTGARQEVVLLSDTLGLSQLVVSQNHHRENDATDQTVLGPFHVAGAPLRPHGYDLAGGADGDPLIVNARVLATDGEPLAGAKVEVWHADPTGGYDTQDPNWSIAEVRYRGNFVTDEAGRFNFRTTMPCSYPIPTDGPVGEMMHAMRRSPMRPAHLHFRIDQPGFDTLVTHVFDAADPFLDEDAVFGVVGSCVAEFLPMAGGGFSLTRDFMLDPLP